MHYSRAVTLGVFTALLSFTRGGERTEPDSQIISLVAETRVDLTVHGADAARWIQVGRNGVVVLPKNGDTAVIFLDSAGRVLGEFGKTGNAPGELRHTSAAGWVGDSLWVYDILQTRATLLKPDRTLGRIEEFETVSTYPLGLYGDGKLLLRTRGGIVRASPDRTTVNAIAPVPGTTTISITKDDGTVVTVRVPVTASPLQTVSAQGQRIGTLTPVFDGSPANVMHLVMQAPGGDTVFMRDYPFTPEPLPPGTLESVTRALLSSAAGDTAFQAKIRAQVKLPPAHPPFTKLLVADDGSSWIVLRPELGGRQRAMILDAGGAFIGTATLGSGVTPMVINATHMWATERLPGGAAGVVRYRVMNSR